MALDFAALLKKEKQRMRMEREEKRDDLEVAKIEKKSNTIIEDDFKLAPRKPIDLSNYLVESSEIPGLHYIPGTSCIIFAVLVHGTITYFEYFYAFL